MPFFVENNCLLKKQIKGTRKFSEDGVTEGDNYEGWS